MQWVCLQFMIVIFPDHTHLLFFTILFLSTLLAFSSQYVHQQNENLLAFCCGPMVARGELLTGNDLIRSL